MTIPPIPPGYRSVTPYLVVDGAARAIAWYAEAFGARERMRLPMGDRIGHAEIEIGDSVVMLADGTPGWPPVPAHVHVYVPDVDATYERALAAGAESVQEPVRKDDEDRRGGVKDPGGTTWWIATRVGMPANS